MYLRRVHGYCYYSGVHAQDERQLSSKCGPIYLRSKILEEQKDEQDVSIFEKQIVDKAQALIDAESQPPKNPDNDEELKSKIESYCKAKTENIGPERYACLICEKNFKGSHFVEKHVQNKHSDKIEDIQRHHFTK